MAYANQTKCTACSRSIPPMPEDACCEELLCDDCYAQWEHAETGSDDNA